MDKLTQKTLALVLSASLLTAYSPLSFAAERQVIAEPTAIPGGTYSDTTMTEHGGVFFINYAPASGVTTLSDAIFENNSADPALQTIGTFTVANGNVEISDTQFNNNTNAWGGAIYTYTGNQGGVRLSIKDSTFTGNEALGAGAIGSVASQKVYAEGGLSLDNVTFTENKATDATDDGAGALFLGSESVTSIANSAFTENTSAAMGGAIATRNPTNANGKKNNNSTGKLDITYTTFSGNTATGDGGAIWNTLYNSVNQDGAVYVANSTFTENQATNGGAIYNSGDQDKAGNAAALYVDNSTFSGNTAAEKGGAIFNGGDLTLQGGTVSGNSSVARGGSIYNTGKLTVDNVTFDQNTTSTGDGGAIFIDVADPMADSPVSITNSTFTNNTALGSGADSGAVSIGNGIVNIDSSTFSGNQSVWGGAIYAYTGNKRGVQVNITNSTFENNQAQSIGAVGNFASQKVLQTGGMTLDNVTFKNNQAVGSDDDDGGGAMFLGAESVTSIANSVFDGNTSVARAGAISTRSADKATNLSAKTDIINTTFTGNTAAKEGGAIDNYFYGSTNQEGAVYIAGSTFEKNQAANGGAIYNHGELDKAGNAAALYVDNSTFSGNTATENGGALYNAGTLTLDGTIAFTGNSAKTGGAIYNEGDMTFNSAATFSGNTAEVGADIYNAGALAFKDAVTLESGIADTNKEGSVTFDKALTLGTGVVQADSITFADNSTLGVTFTNDTMGNLDAHTVSIGSGANLLVTLSTDFLTTDKTTHDLIHEDASVTGEFTLADVTNALYDVSLADNVVTAQRKSAAETEEVLKESGANDNAIGVVEAFTSASDLGSDKANQAAAVINALAQTDVAAAVKAAKALAPEEASTRQVIHTAATNQLFAAIGDHLGNVAGSVSAPRTYALGDSAANYNGQNYSVWVQGLLNKTHKEQTDTAAFTGNSTGLAGGADIKLGEDWLAGVGYAYTHTNVNATGRHDRILGDNFFTYGQFRPGQFFVQGAFTYGDSKYEEDKYVGSALVDADYHVKSYAVNVTTGYDVTDWLTPLLGVRYMALHQEGYKDSADQNVHAEQNNYFTGTLGLSLQQQYTLRSGLKLLPQVKAGVAYDFHSQGADSRVNLPNGTLYAIEGERLHRLSFETGAALTALVAENIEATLGYEGSFRQDYNSHTGTLKLRYLF